MAWQNIPVFGEQGSAPLTSKYEFFGSPPDVSMVLTPQQQMGLAWLLMSKLALREGLQLRHRGGPWLEVASPEGEFAVWDTTGAVYRVINGAVEDDPIYEPPREVD